ncbi:cytochrome b-c1 complex subunit Rieske, mitochondrial [Petromyzon marinus]|uniref:Cytochrome b-c1 complex subunit Rieske, mitochondrial n=1 Tax=Petromyzon marinus TaxID=7757 RepID=A0AAJ7U9E8_PETMA|nr:cytochrome b-c1 complex subunit Rieske, mitochondrial [Petromyzon marinus]
MIGLVSRLNALGPYASASSSIVASQLKTLVVLPSQAAERVVADAARERLTAAALRQLLPRAAAIAASSSPSATSSVRFAHTDVSVPDYSAYRRSNVQDSTKSSKDSYDSRKAFTYLVSGAAAVASLYVAKAAVVKCVATLSASADVMAMAKIEVKLNNIGEGQNVTLKWRGKPLFIRHRTAEEVNVEQKVNLADLRHPEHDNERAKKPEWLIVLGVCTHLGCVPIPNMGEYNGYYCPCHGSHYDNSGRIRKGPAPLNLEVPYYEFLDEDTVVVG